MDHLVKQGIDLCFLQDTLPNQSGLEFCQTYTNAAETERIPSSFFRATGIGTGSTRQRSGRLSQDALPNPGSPGLVENWCQMILSPNNGQAQALLLESDGATNGDRPLILLVDDSKIIHTFIGNALRESPYHLLSAYDGGEGFRLAVEHVPDLLISDIDMPVMNGYEMCQRIKETESTRGIPILILSARGAGVDIDHGFDAGANDFLTKTVADNELLSRIEMTLDSALASQREKSSSSKTAACNARLTPRAWCSRT